LEIFNESIQFEILLHTAELRKALINSKNLNFEMRNAEFLNETAQVAQAISNVIIISKKRADVLASLQIENDIEEILKSLSFESSNYLNSCRIVNSYPCSYEAKELFYCSIDYLEHLSIRLEGLVTCKNPPIYYLQLADKFLSKVAIAQLKALPELDAKLISALSNLTSESDDSADCNLNIILFAELALVIKDLTDISSSFATIGKLYSNVRAKLKSDFRTTETKFLKQSTKLLSLLELLLLQFDHNNVQFARLVTIQGKMNNCHQFVLNCLDVYRKYPVETYILKINLTKYVEVLRELADELFKNGVIERFHSYVCAFKDLVINIGKLFETRDVFELQTKYYFVGFILDEIQRILAKTHSKGPNLQELGNLIKLWQEKKLLVFGNDVNHSISQEIQSFLGRIENLVIKLRDELGDAHFLVLSRNLHSSKNERQTVSKLPNDLKHSTRAMQSSARLDKVPHQDFKRDLIINPLKADAVGLQIEVSYCDGSANQMIQNIDKICILFQKLSEEHTKLLLDNSVEQKKLFLAVVTEIFKELNILIHSVQKLVEETIDNVLKSSLDHKKNSLRSLVQQLKIIAAVKANTEKDIDESHQLISVSRNIIFTIKGILRDWIASSLVGQSG
jgi:hypothetical protein